MPGVVIGRASKYAGAGSKTNQNKLYDSFKSGPVTDRPEDSIRNEQALRLVLIADILKSAGHCDADMREELNRYVRSLSFKARQQLSLHFPYAKGINKTAISFAPSVLDGLAQLSGVSADKRLPLECLNLMLTKARNNFVTRPESVFGQDGWLTYTLRNLNRYVAQPKKDKDGNDIPNTGGFQDRYHFASFENGMFAIVSAYLKLVVPATVWSAAGSQFAKAHREAWWNVFSLHQRHFDNVCTCTDQGFAMPEDMYSGCIVMSNEANLLRAEELVRSKFESLGINAQLKAALDPLGHYNNIEKPQALQKHVFTTLHWENPALAKLCQNLPYHVRNKSQDLKVELNEAHIGIGTWYGKRLEELEVAGKQPKGGKP